MAVAGYKRDFTLDLTSASKTLLVAAGQRSPTDVTCKMEKPTCTQNGAVGARP